MHIYIYINCKYNMYIYYIFVYIVYKMVHTYKINVKYILNTYYKYQ